MKTEAVRRLPDSRPTVTRNVQTITVGRELATVKLSSLGRDSDAQAWSAGRVVARTTVCAPYVVQLWRLSLGRFRFTARNHGTSSLLASIQFHRFGGISVSLGI